MDHTKLGADQIVQGSSATGAGNPLLANLDGVFLDGPVTIGTNPTAFPTAVLNVGPPSPPLIPSLTGLFKGILTENKLGIMNKLGTMLSTGIKKALGIKVHTGLKQQNGLNNQNGAKFMTGVAFSGTAIIQPGHVLAAKKNFDIPHPSKPGHRLRYVCVETPEAGVYIRGKLDGEHIIKLPDYWKNLVHEDSITVQLTAWKYSDSSLYVKSITSDEIVIGSTNLTKVYCHYTVYAERKDCERNISEYEGETPADYPGDASQCSVAGYDY